MGNLPISVIIITKNAMETIEECLKSVQANNPAEIIVVDGNSSDRTVEIARGYTDRIYSDGGKGKTFARQLGAEEATQEYIAYVDSDITLTEGALATMLGELQGSVYISISAHMLPGTENDSYWGWAGWQHNRYSQLRRHQGFIATASCLLRRETILRYKFDNTPGGYLDDMLLELKLKRDGHRLGVSSIPVYHHHRTDLKSFISYRFFLGSLNPSLIRKQGPWHARLWPPAYTIYWLGFCLIKGKPKLIPYFVVNGMVQTAGMVKGFLELIKGRRE